MCKSQQIHSHGSPTTLILSRCRVCPSFLGIAIPNNNDKTGRGQVADATIALC